MWTHSPVIANASMKRWSASRAVQDIVSSELFGWRSMVMQCTFNPVQDRTYTPSVSAYGLVCVLSGQSRVTGRFIGGARDETFIPDGMMLLHPNDPANGHWDAAVKAGILLLSPMLFTDFADDAYHGDPAHVQLVSRINFFDPLLSVLMRELCRELAETNPYGVLFADSISQTITLHLLRRYSSVAVNLPTQSRKLTPTQAKTIHDFIHDHLDQKITLDDLSRAIHVSVPHFERLFRATYYRPPYHYVLECRIECAQALLIEGKSTLHEVARRCGFAHQSHLTRHFTRMIGVSPARFATKSTI